MVLKVIAGGGAGGCVGRISRNRIKILKFHQPDTKKNKVSFISLN